MKISLTFIFAGLLAWVSILALYYSFIHHPVQSLVIPMMFLLHKFVENKYVALIK